ncbi:MAG: signal recognition particle protein [Deltaproteobacteria bacterium]|jgi:signal recognition particle subunit SRP54|nr:signal recognition particle protein [Deltaproteobacteria bacterium]
MFEKLSDKLTATFNRLIGRGKITEEALKEALKEVRLALLEADVNFKVVKDFLAVVEQKALGQDVIKSLSPGQMVIKVVNDELTAMMGQAHVGLDFSGAPPLTIMLVGLQGSGKTTTAAKLALYLKKNSHRPYLVPADTQRPAAIEQLKILASEVNVPVYPSTTDLNPVELSRLGVQEAVRSGSDVVLIDTAGRLSIDEELMDQLSDIKRATQAREILLVADAMTGQEAVNIAKDFNDKLDLSGVILSKMEGDARGGAAMSMRAVIQKPLKYMGTGEKLDALEAFHPDRVASLILGMGDILTLIEKAQETVSMETAQELTEKMQTDGLNLNDFRQQLEALKKVGTVDSFLSMIPGLGKLKKIKEATPDNNEMKKIEAMIDSMTKEERLYPNIIDSSRRRRIASGSGTKPQDVQKFLKSFHEMKKIMREMGRGKSIPGIFKRLLS